MDLGIFSKYACNFYNTPPKFIYDKLDPSGSKLGLMYTGDSGFQYIKG